MGRLCVRPQGPQETYRSLARQGAVRSAAHRIKQRNEEKDRRKGRWEVGKDLEGMEETRERLQAALLAGRRGGQEEEGRESVCVKSAPS